MHNSKVVFTLIEDSSDDEEHRSTSTKSNVKKTSFGRINLFRSRSYASSCGDNKNERSDNENISTTNMIGATADARIVSPHSSTSECASESNKASSKKSNEIGSSGQVNSLPPSSLGFRTNKPRFGKFYRKGKSHAGTTIPDPTNQMQSSIATVEDEEIDPVMVLFEARATQRVRFSLDEEIRVTADGNNDETMDLLVEPKQANQSKTSVIEAKHIASKMPYSIKQFMKNALFGGENKTSAKAEIDEFERELADEIESATQNLIKDGSDVEGMVWTSSSGYERNEVDTALGTVLESPSSGANNIEVGEDLNPYLATFEEDPVTRGTFLKLLNKARRARFVYYRYQYAVRTYIKALELLKNAGYPDKHPSVEQTMKSLNNAYFAVSSLKNSANIVKLGIKYEDAGELVRALKMYTIAYRIRRDNLSATHPSLVVLLNMLGSIQIKRGELHEAMAIYELALKDAGLSQQTHSANNESGSQVDGDSFDKSILNQPAPIGTFLTRSVAYREMGSIYQEWGDMDTALENYHKSLECMAIHKGIAEKYQSPARVCSATKNDRVEENSSNRRSSDCDGEGFDSKFRHDSDDRNYYEKDSGGMEMTFSETNLDIVGNASPRKLGISGTKKESFVTPALPCCYDVFFPLTVENKKHSKKNGKKSTEEKNGDFTDVEIAQTIHRIAQLHRTEGEYDQALPVFNVALRGMKHALGKTHPNVAAILGNIGNLQKEMGDMDSAYRTYQQVLAIEAYRLGLSHPDVVITLHNIATIDAGRGNLSHALSLYTQVLSLQRKLFGEDHDAVAVTSTCMGDVYERNGDSQSALDCYEEALRIKISSMGRHSLEVARLLHKLGKLAVSVDDYHLALSYLSKAALVYRLNKLRDDDEWMIDVTRATADVEASIAMGRGVYFEC